MSGKKQSKNLLSWLRRRNWTDFIAALALLLSVISLYHDLYPPPSRGRLTIFIESCPMSYGTANELNVDIIGKIVNDGSLTCVIRTCELSVLVNVTYKISEWGRLNLPKQTISPAERIDFTVGKALTGENDTLIPQTAIRNCVVTIWFKDCIGMQVAQEEYPFV